MEEPRIGAVENAKAIFAGLHFEKGKQLAIDQNRVAEDFRDPRRVGIGRNRIVKLACSSQHPIDKHQGNFVFAFGEIESVFEARRGSV